ncbi:MAG TPA: HD domain-containing phosphohydrolase [Nitrospirota bacterium]
MQQQRKYIISTKDASIGHRLKLSYFITSIIPIAIMTYLYLGPETEGGAKVETWMAVVLLLTLFLSILGLMLTNKAASDSISSLSRLNGRMDSLLDLTKNFRESYYVDVLLDSVAKSACQLLDADAASILLYDEAGNLRFQHMTGEAAAALKGKTVKPGEGLTGWVAQEGKAVIVGDVSKDPRFSPAYDKETGFKTNSIVCVPLTLDGRNIGVIEVLNKKNKEEFTEQDLKMLFSLSDHAAISIQRSQSYETSHNDFMQITELLVTAMDYHVPEKKGHARRVARYAIRLAKGLGLNEDEQKSIYFGALLHDIGLLKYSQDEYWGKKEFRMHPTLGFELIKNVSEWKKISPLVLCHHERYDGGGYPAGLSGQAIPLGARIIALAEVLDVMAGPKTYKPVMSFQDAVADIKDNSGTQFDPHVVDIFLANFRKEDLEQ